MIIEPFFVTGVVIVFTCLLLIVLAIAVLYFRASKAFSALNTEFILYKRDQETQARAALQAATKKADEIITSTQLFSEQTRKAVMDAVNKSIVSGQSTYSQIIKEMGDKSVNDILTYSDSLKKSMEQEASTLTETYKSELKSEEHEFHAALDKNEAAIIKDLQTKAMSMLPDILKEASIEALTPEDIESSITTALEKIKKQHGFS